MKTPDPVRTSYLGLEIPGPDSLGLLLQVAIYQRTAFKERK